MSLPLSFKKLIIQPFAVVVNCFLAGLERIELPPSVSKTEMISISPKTQIEFVSSCVPHIATIFPCNKAGWVKIRHLGFVQTILQLYSDLPIGRGSNPLPSTVSVLRRNLNSVTLLADTYKTWCNLQGSNLLQRCFKPPL